MNIKQISSTLPTAARANAFSISILVITLFYFILSSNWFDEWDSIQFAHALDGIDLANHYPHPPGYAAYVYLGKLFHWIFQDKHTALILLSNLAGAASLVLLFRIGEALHSKTLGFLAALILFCQPTFNHFSAIAMTDVVVVPFLLFSVYILIKTLSGTNPTLFAIISCGLLTGWGVGVRPQYIILFSFVSSLHVLVTPRFKPKLLFILSGLIGTLFWLLPIASSQGGISKYLTLAQGQFSAYPEARLNFGWEKIVKLIHLLVEKWQAPSILLGILISLLIVLSFKRLSSWRAPKKEWLVLIALFVIGTATTLTFHPIKAHRVIIPMLPWLSVLLAFLVVFSLSHIKLKQLRQTATLAVAIVLAIAAFNSLSLQKTLSRSIPPPVDAAQFIYREFTPDKTLLTAVMSRRHWQYYCPDFPFVDYHYFDRIKPSQLEEKDFIISDTLLASFPFSEKKLFKRSPIIYRKHNSVTLYIYDISDQGLLFLSGAHDNDGGGFWTESKINAFYKSETGPLFANMSIKSILDRPSTLTISSRGIQPSLHTGISTQRSLNFTLSQSQDWVPVDFSSNKPPIIPSEIGHSPDERPLTYRISDIHISNGNYELNRPISLDLLGNSGNLQMSGFGAPESWGIWSTGEHSSLILQSQSTPKSSKYLSLEGQFFDDQAESDRKISIVANGTTIYGPVTIHRSNFPNENIHLPAEIFRNTQSIHLEFQFENLYSPQEKGMSNDSRKLGIALTNLTITDFP